VWHCTSVTLELLELCHGMNMVFLITFLAILLGTPRITAYRQLHSPRQLLAQQDGASTASYNSVWGAAQK
jgi:hypothetical protein